MIGDGMLLYIENQSGKQEQKKEFMMHFIW